MDFEDDSDYSYESESESSDYSEIEEDSAASDTSEDSPPKKRPKIQKNTNQIEEWKWKNENNSPKLKPFTAKPGIKDPVLSRLGLSPTPLDFFEEVFDKDFWQILADETNRYAEQVINGEAVDTETKKIDEKWYPVTVDEMKGYVALSILMTQVKKPCVQMNWSKRVIIYTPIYEQTMPYRRFLVITRFLHFADNNYLHKGDKMCKVRNVVNYFNEKFEELYTPNEHVSIDESLMKFNGRLGCVVFVRIKRARYGIKFYKLCESSSGYCLSFKIYTGQSQTSDADDLNVSETVVRDLSKLIINKGYTLYLDNWYSSPKIFEYLLDHDTNAIGTVRNNRKNMPKDLAKLKLKKGETAIRSTRGILALKWSDRKDVFLLSTKHVNEQMTDTGKKKVGKGGKTELKNTIKPKCVIEYNHGMGGVDHQDQVLACFPLMRKFVKGYRKIFFYMFDMALFNSYVLYSKTQPKRDHYVNYRLDVSEQLLKKISLPNYNVRGRPAHDDTPLRLQAVRWGHFSQHIASTEKKARPTRACRVCSKHKKRSETTWECKKCLVALHVSDCFERYHTLHNY